MSLSLVELFRHNSSRLAEAWIYAEDLEKFFERQGIERAAFTAAFGVPIIDYFAGVFEGTKKIGSCPVIAELLTFLESRSVASHELFLLCTTLRKKSLDLLFDMGIGDKSHVNYIHSVFDKNFEGVLAYYEDVIYEKEQELIHSEFLLNSYKNAVDSSSIFVMANLEGNIIYANRQFCEVSGYAVEEILGRHYNMIRHPDTTHQFYEEMWRIIQKQQIWHGIIKNRKKNGEDFYLDQFIIPVLDRKGEIQEFLSISRDVTGEKLFEKKNKEQEKLLMQQLRMAAMGEMINMIAHQWRQPLATIGSLTANLQVKLRLDRIEKAQLESSLQNISEQLQLLSATINDFRDYFNPKREKKMLNLGDDLDRMVNIVAKSLESNNITIKKSYRFEHKIKTYHNELIQVLLNIVKNAQEALVRRSVEKPRISIVGYERRDLQVIEISDNAGGIADELMSQVFDPYFSTKNKQQGAGMGLYIAKTIVEKHCHGSLLAENDAEGAKFTLILPMRREKNGTTDSI